MPDSRVAILPLDWQMLAACGYLGGRKSQVCCLFFMLSLNIVPDGLVTDRDLSDVSVIDWWPP